MAERVRKDRARKAGGFGVAAAAGVDASIAIISERDLINWTALSVKSETDAANAKAFDASREAKKQLSTARASGWTGTVDGSRIAKLNALRDRAVQAEERRRKIDEEEAALQAEQALQHVQESNRKLFQRDQRVLVLNSELLHQHVVEERSEQLQISARKKHHEEERQAFFHEQAMESARKAQEAEEEKQRSARLRARDAALTCQLQLAEQKAGRLQQKIEIEAEGKVIRAQAEAEAAELRARAEERRREAKELAYFRLKQHSEATEAGSPRRTARQRLEASLDDGDQISDSDYAQMKSLHLEMRQARLSEKKEARDQLLAAAQDALMQSPQRKMYQPEMSPRDINGIIHEREQNRVNQKESAKIEYRQSLEQQAMRRKQTLERLSGDHPDRAEATRVLTAILEQEDIEERQAKKREAQQIDRIRELQAREKACREAEERRRELVEGISMIQAIDKEDETIRNALLARAEEANLSPVAQRRIIDAAGWRPSPPKVGGQSSPRTQRLA